MGCPATVCVFLKILVLPSATVISTRPSSSKSATSSASRMLIPVRAKSTLAGKDVELIVWLVPNKTLKGLLNPVNPCTDKLIRLLAEFTGITTEADVLEDGVMVAANGPSLPVEDGAMPVEK